MHQTDQNLLIDKEYKGYLLSTNKELLNLEIIHYFLCNDSYWAKNIPFKTVEIAVQNSICIGIYDQEMTQVGFGRMITDRATFAYVADVFIVQNSRGIGLSKLLMKAFCDLADNFHLRRFVLTTQDAHQLYNQFGFEPFPYPERLMSRPGVTYNK